jgi:hypothetical protein
LYEERMRNATLTRKFDGPRIVNYVIAQHPKVGAGS